MTLEEVKQLFAREVAKPEFSKRPEFDKQKVYNYRKRTKDLGTMIEVLYTIGAIEITKK